MKNLASWMSEVVTGINTRVGWVVEDRMAVVGNE